MHTVFNIVNTVVFLPMLNVFVKVVTRLAPDKKELEAAHLKYLKPRLISSPTIGVQQSHAEITEMGRHLTGLFKLLRRVLTEKGNVEKMVKKIFQEEDFLDSVQKEITEFLSALLSGNLPHEITEIARVQLRLADEYESISDYVKDILKLYLKKKSNLIMFSDEGWHEVLDLHDETAKFVNFVLESVEENKTAILPQSYAMGDEITKLMKDVRVRHLERIGTDSATPLSSLIFTDMLNSYRRIKDHALNIAEALAGEK